MIRINPDRSADTALVTWMAPSGGAPVTGYTVHYSGGGDTGFVNVGSSTTATTINGRINDGRTYIVTVDAKSEHLFGESVAKVILSECNGYWDVLSQYLYMYE